MSEDRTQGPSKLRRREARERGQVARSAELTAAAGLLAGVVLLGAWGDDLAQAMGQMIREPFQVRPPVFTDLASVVAALRASAWRMMLPLGAILGGVIVTVVGTHQIQVGGLWVPSLLAPDIRRLWLGGAGSGPLERAVRGAWSLVKATVVIAVAGWSLSTRRVAFEALGGLEPGPMAAGAGTILFNLAVALAITVLALGVVDYIIGWFRFEARLRMTPEEQREELRALDGDPALRARRRRMAATWRRGAPDSLSGASLLLTAPGGLAVLLGGGPPPRRINVLNVARGASAWILRRAAERSGCSCVESPELARYLARGPGAAANLPENLRAELVGAWPSN
jgi:flagellar biosynthetic protein FlhB